MLLFSVPILAEILEDVDKIDNKRKENNLNRVELIVGITESSIY